MILTLWKPFVFVCWICRVQFKTWSSFVLTLIVNIWVCVGSCASCGDVSFKYNFGLVKRRVILLRNLHLQEIDIQMLRCVFLLLYQVCIFCKSFTLPTFIVIVVNTVACRDSIGEVVNLEMMVVILEYCLVRCLELLLFCERIWNCIFLFCLMDKFEMFMFRYLLFQIQIVFK
jgi:hypothetical protein